MSLVENSTYLYWNFALSEFIQILIGKWVVDLRPQPLRPEIRKPWRQPPLEVKNQERNSLGRDPTA